MKTIQYMCMLAAIVSLSTGCLKDKDSFATKDYDFVVAVENVASSDENGYELFLGDELPITPIVTLSEGAKEEDYDYRWIVGKGEVISTEKNLKWKISLPEGYDLEKTIPGVFVVRNKVNELEYRSDFQFKVRTGYAPNYIAVYELKNGGIEWASIQGSNPSGFTRFFTGMYQSVNKQTIKGKFKGVMPAKNEMAIFTDHAPDYGFCISMVDSDGDQDFNAVLGEVIAPIKGRVYMGTGPMNVAQVTYGKGGVKYIEMNNSVYAFNGTGTDLPVFDDNSFLKEEDVVQTMASKQKIGLKKATVVRHTDKSLSCYHVFDDKSTPVLDNSKAPIKADDLCGMFNEGTGLGSNTNYKTHLVVRNGAQYSMHIFDVIYINKVVQPLKLTYTVTIPADIAQSAVTWYGTFSNVRKGFYATKNAVYRFDYLNLGTPVNPTFAPEAKPFVAFDSKYELTDLFVMIAGSGLKDADDCTVAALYDKSKDSTTLYVYDTVTGEKIAQYTDVIPGKVLEFYKK